MIRTDDLGRAFEVPTATNTSTDTLTTHTHVLTTLADLLGTSIGPNGLDKVIIGEDDDLTVTNDGATILKSMEMKTNPISRLVVELSEAMDEEIGDGTTSVVILAAALLREAAELVNKGVHPISVCTGFEEALKKANEHIVSIQNSLPAEELKNLAARTSLNSKIVNKAIDKFCSVCVEAVTAVIDSERGDLDFERINIESKIGSDLNETVFMEGVVINKEFSHSQMKKEFKNARMALLSCPFEPPKLKTKNDVVIETVGDYEKLEKYEKKVFFEMVEVLKRNKVEIVLCQWGFDHEANSLLLQSGIGAVRWVGGNDMERIALHTGANIVSRFSDLREEDCAWVTVTEKCLGTEDEKVVVIVGLEDECVENKSVCSDDETGMKNFDLKVKKSKKSGTILVRGANDVVLAEAKRAINDALCVVRNVCVDSRIVYGGGSADLSCATVLQEAASKLAGPVAESFLGFSKALEEIPVHLAKNAGLNALQYVSELKIRNAENCFLGVDCGDGEDMKNNGVFETVMAKTRMLEMATQLVIMILRIEEVVIE